VGRRRLPNLPNLPDTGRRYVDDTLRARLASPGVERYQRAGGGTGGRVALAVIAVVVLLAAMLWLAG
jgi:hypothetical protein